MQLISYLKTSLHKIIIRSTTALILAASFAGPALALDGDAFVARLQDILQQNRIVMKNTGLTVTGNSATLHNVTVMGSGRNTAPDTPVPLGDVIFNEVTEGTEGSYKIGSINIGDVDFTENDTPDGGRIIIQGIEAADIHLGPEEAPGQLLSLLYGRTMIRKFRIENNGQSLFTAENIVSVNSKGDSEDSVRNDSSIGSFEFNPSALPEKESRTLRETMAGLGYDRIRGKMNMRMLWDAEKGDLDFSQYDLALQDGGTLRVTVRLSGITRDIAGELHKIIGRKPASNKDEQVRALAFIGILQQAGVSSITIRYDDDSLVNRVIDHAAKSSGRSRAEVISRFRDKLFKQAKRLKNPEFTDKAIRETHAFLDNPKSLEISVKPEKSVSLANIAAIGATLPQKLIDMLRINIAANQ